MNKMPAHLAAQKVKNIAGYISAKENIRNVHSRITPDAYLAKLNDSFIPMQEYIRLMGNPEEELLPLNFKGENKDGTKF